MTVTTKEAWTTTPPEIPQEVEFYWVELNGEANEPVALSNSGDWYGFGGSEKINRPGSMIRITAYGPRIPTAEELSDLAAVREELRLCRQLLRDGRPPGAFSGMDEMKWNCCRNKQVEKLEAT